MSILDELIAREVYDSQGLPTLEIEVVTEAKARGRSGAASGGSIGQHEARELLDNDPKRFGGRGVRKAVARVASEVAPRLRGFDLDDQQGVDDALIALDGTLDKSRLGANTTLAVSMASAQAAAIGNGEPLYLHLNRLWKQHLGDDAESAEPMLPLPMAHMISGTTRVGRTLDFQDVLMIPIGARDFSEALGMVIAVYHALGAILQKHGHASHLVCSHGGFGPRLRSNAQAVDHLLEAVIAAGLDIGRDVAVAIDVAATHVLDASANTYKLTFGQDSHDAPAMIAMLEHWTRQYPILSIEDGLGDDDWEGWTELTTRLGATVQIVGDDLFATRVDRLELGEQHQAANAVVIKPGQVGTLTETFRAMAQARRMGHRAIIAARSGETEDTTIADLAVATAAGQIKIGGISRSERMVKYNRLLRIEEELGPNPRFAGRSVLTPCSRRSNGRGPAQERDSA